MKITFFTAVAASAVLLVSASVWEGVSAMASAKELPGKYTVATNAFPHNSIVEITNLENGKTVRVKVTAGLETAGLLAALSRDAAEAIDLRDTFTCRVRMSLPPDDIAFANFRLGPVASDETLISDESRKEASEVETAAPLSLAAGTESARTAAAADSVSDNPPVSAAENTPAALAAVNASVLPVAETEAAVAAATPTDSISDNPPVYAAEDTLAAAVDTPVSPAAETEPAMADAPAASALDTIPEAAAPVIADAVENQPVPEYSSGWLSMVPAEERLPEVPNQYAAAPEPKAGEAVPAEERSPEVPNQYAAAPEPKAGEAVPAARISAAEYVPPSGFSPFQVPLISRLERGKCYVQVGAYTRSDYVEDEVNRIGTAYPLAIQNIGTDTNPMFRVLLGPLNQGESEAMLQRFKSIGYKDAFVWSN